MTIRIAFALCAAVTTAAIPSAAITASVQPSSSVARDAAERLLAEFNSPGSMGPFVLASFSATSLARESASERARQFDRLKNLTGGFKILEFKSSGERMIEVLAVSRRGDRHAKFVLFTSGKEPGKIADVFVLPERDPSRAAADAFPAEPLGEQEMRRLVRRRIDALVEEGSFSGAILVAHGDKVIVREARGLANETWRTPNRLDTRFNLASVNKMWTAIVVLKLAEIGRLSLDDTIDKLVPGYPHREAASKITLRQLLQHRGGIGEWDVRTLASAQSSIELAATMTAPPSDPGKNFAYSNAGYVLLGAAAEAATRLPYERLVQEYVFKPAGMKSSGFWPVTSVEPNRATGYLRPADDPLGFGPLYSNEQFLGYSGNASGGAYSTIDDMLAFHRALAKGRLLNADMTKEMIGTSVEFAGAPRPARYGLGLRLENCADSATLGHGGGGPNSGVSSATFATVDGSWTIVVLGNRDPMPEQLAFEVCELVHRK